MTWLTVCVVISRVEACALVRVSVELLPRYIPPHFDFQFPRPGLRSNPTEQEMNRFII